MKILLMANYANTSVLNLYTSSPVIELTIFNYLLSMTYIQLLQAAQLATTREEARKCLQLAYQYNLVENCYQQRAFHVAMNR